MPKIYTFPGKGLNSGRRTGFENRVASALRDYLSVAQRGRCYHCGVEMTLEGDTGCTLDHWPIPRRDGGELSPINCVAACFKCNTAASNCRAPIPGAHPFIAPCSCDAPTPQTEDKMERDRT